MAKAEHLLSHWLLMLMAFNVFVKDKTLDEFWEVYNWSMFYLWLGKWPYHNEKQQPFTAKDGYRYAKRGTYLASGWRGLLVQNRGDLQFIHLVYHWNTFMHKFFMCHRCLASGVWGDFIFSNVRENAPHRCTIIRHQDYMANTTAEQRSRLCQCVGWHHQIVFADEMHGINLGLQDYLNASLLQEISLEMQAIEANVSQEDCLKQIWLDYKIWKNRRFIKCSLPQLSKATIGKTSAQSMPSMKTKAWNNRVLGAFLAELTHRDHMRNLSDEYKRLRATCAWAIAEWLFCGEIFGRCLSPDQAQRMWVAGRTFLVTYTHLAHIAREKAVPLYNVTYKLHQFDHMVTDVKMLRLNPKYFHCFADEDMVGKVAAVCKRTHRSNMDSFDCGFLYRLQNETIIKTNYIYIYYI